MATPDSDDRELTRLVNALVTEASMTREELDAVARFAELGLMLISGTVFAAIRHVAMQMHNRALARIAGVPSRDEARWRRREREHDEEALLPIEP